MVSKQKILIVDDDNNIAELISLYLTKECFDTMIVNDGESVMPAMETFAPNLILLDLMLPGIDGYQVCREVRAQYSVPIIMLSAKGEVFDKVLGLELGADDYMEKPFDSKELVARAKAVLRRYKPSNAPTENPNTDFAEAMLNTTFDWNGAREPYILATENDVLNGLGMLFLKLLTNRAQIFADVRTYWSPEAVKKAAGYEVEGVAKEAGGFIHLINSGAACLDASGQARDAEGNSVMKPWYEVTEEDQKAMLEATTWSEADFGYFRGGGYSSRFVTEAQMPVTMIRLNLVKGIGPTLQIAEGWTVKLPEKVTDILWKRTDYTWPCTWFAPRCNGKEGPFKSAYDVMNNWGANHGAISYGHVGADLITLCSMLRIPVSMHNVPEEKIFRPASWNAFGMDKEGQDYRACAAYGPMYK